MPLLASDPGHNRRGQAEKSPKVPGHCGAHSSAREEQPVKKAQRRGQEGLENHGERTRPGAKGNRSVGKKDMMEIVTHCLWLTGH